jgi:hypothetical protein
MSPTAVAPIAACALVSPNEYANSRVKFCDESVKIVREQMRCGALLLFRNEFPARRTADVRRRIDREHIAISEDVPHPR